MGRWWDLVKLHAETAVRGQVASELNVRPADLMRVAGTYGELAARARLLSPQSAAEVQRIAETRGPMGYPAAAGIAAGLSKAEGPLNAKAADFQAYSQRFNEHAATYSSEDREAAARTRASVDDQIVGPRDPQGPKFSMVDNTFKLDGGPQPPPPPIQPRDLRVFSRRTLMTSLRDSTLPRD
jgi:Excreted virulence factor EspC, type VII ESX diderm